MTFSETLVSPGREYFDFNIKYLYAVGLWPKNARCFNKPDIYKMYDRNLHLLSVIYLVLTTIGTYDIKDDKAFFMGNLDKTLIGYSFVFKIICYEVSRKNLQILINDIMQSGDRITEKCKKRMPRLVMFITTVVCGIFGAFSMSALYDGDMTVESWMPFDPRKSKMNLLLAAQITAVLFVVPCGLRGIAIQGIICSIIMYFCEQMKEVQRRLRSLEYSLENDASIREDFRDIVKKHVRLIGYSKVLEESFKQFFLVHNLAMTVEMCLNALMVSVVGTHQLKLLVTFLAFLGIAMFNTYIFCYLGNEMILESLGISLAAYEAPWTSWPVDMQKDLLTIITVAQRPLKLTAGGLSLVSLQSYCQILYNGYSIFAMLHDMM